MPKYKFLIADYEPRNIEKIQALLQKNFDCETELASNGIAAVELFNRMKPDVVLLEAMIPRKHGFEVCLEIKNTPQGKNTPVIITTQFYKGSKYRNQAVYSYKCDDYIEKPCSDEVIIATIKKYIRGIEEPVMKPEAIEHQKVPVVAQSGSSEHQKVPVVAESVVVEDKEVPAIAEKQEQIVAEQTKSGIPEDVEREITAKVFETLTLFEREERLASFDRKEKEEEREIIEAVEEKAKEKAEMAELKTESTIEEEVKEFLEEKADRIQAMGTAELAPAEKPAPPSGSTVSFQQEAEKPELMNLEELRTVHDAIEDRAARTATIPLKIPLQAAVERPKVNFKIMMIGISVLVCLGIMAVVFPLFKKRTDTVQLLESSLQLGSGAQDYAQANSVGSIPVTPAGSNDNVTERAEADNANQQAAASAGKAFAKPAGKTLHQAGVKENVQQVPKQDTQAETVLNQVQAEIRVQDVSIPLIENDAQLKQPSSDEVILIEAAAQPSPVIEKSARPDDGAAIQTVVSQEIPQSLPERAQEQIPEQVQRETPEPVAQVKAGDIVEYGELDQDPAYIVHSMPRYTMLAKQKGIEGAVVLNVLIGEDGRVQDVKIIRALESSLDESAVHAAKRWVYAPPTKSGIPVRLWKTETVTFLK